MSGTRKPPRSLIPEDPEEEERTPLEFDDEPWEAFVPDDDHEPQPEPGDFWTERDPQSLRLGHLAIGSAA